MHMLLFSLTHSHEGCWRVGRLAGGMARAALAQSCVQSHSARGAFAQVLQRSPLRASSTLPALV